MGELPQDLDVMCSWVRSGCQSHAHDAIGGIASIYDTNCADDVPLGNILNIG